MGNDHIAEIATIEASRIQREAIGRSRSIDDLLDSLDDIEVDDEEDDVHDACENCGNTLNDGSDICDQCGGDFVEMER